VTTNSKARVTILTGVAFAIVFLALALRDADLETIFGILVNSDLWFLPLVASSLMLQFWFKAVRWKYFLSPFSDVESRAVYPATVVGYLANLVLPLYLGEVARTYILSRQLELRYSSVLATVVLERVFDFLSILFFVGLVLLIDSRAPSELRLAGQFSAIAFVTLLAFLSAFLLWTDLFKRIVLSLSSMISSKMTRALTNQLDLALVGLQSLRDLRRLPAILIASLLQWGSMGICVYAGILGTGIQAPASAGFVVLALTVLAVTLPSSPGFFGTIQLCFTIGLAAYGISASDAFAASVYFHLTIYVTGWTAGLYFLGRSGLTVRSLRQIPETSRVSVDGRNFNRDTSKPSGQLPG
jgi:uncharacterized protein (TIRG00374 family)